MSARSKKDVMISKSGKKNGMGRRPIKLDMSKLRFVQEEDVEDRKK